jgi:Alpha-lytic protease prodomain
MAGRFRVGAALTAIVVLTAAGLIEANGAQADPKLTDPDQQLLQATNLEQQLGSRAVGTYFDDVGRLVVAVSDEATAELVREAGAVPKLVRFTAAQLDSVQSALDHLATTSGAGQVRSWYVDPLSGTVVVTADPRAHDKATQRFLRQARANGSKVTVRRSRGKLTTTADLLGGYQVDKSTGYICSLGFNARSGDGSSVFITAGHCTAGRPSFSRAGTMIGTTRSSSFPADDFGTVNVIHAWDQRGAVERWNAADVAVLGRANATVGSKLCKSGRSTKWTCGKIVAKGVTVNYGAGKVVKGLFRHTACVEGGDSGGPNMTGNYAQGITSGAALISGLCMQKYRQVNESYSQPISEALSASGVSLVLG